MAPLVPLVRQMALAMVTRKGALGGVVTRRKGGRVGVPKGTYEQMCGLRGEVCWICGATPKTRRLHIDHDHRTLELRGLLCFNCNRRLSKGTSAWWLRAAASYLEGRAGDDPPPPPEFPKQPGYEYGGSR